VFENHRDLFSSVVTIVNTEAIKLNGDILALASICLASMNADVGVGCGVPIPKFLAYVFHSLQPAQLDTNLINQTIKGIEELLSGHSIKDTTIPCIAPADSVQALLSSGTLKRPRVAEMRDGAVYGQENNRLLHIECKNHAKGVDKSVFQEVIKWMRVGFKISLFFFSSVQNIFTNVSGTTKIGWSLSLSCPTSQYAYSGQQGQAPLDVGGKWSADALTRTRNHHPHCGYLCYWHVLTRITLTRPRMDCGGLGSCLCSCQSHSAPGLTDGAVVATNQGDVFTTGIMDGNRVA
jgi:hypothetical protein